MGFGVRRGSLGLFCRNGTFVPILENGVNVPFLFLPDRSVSGLRFAGCMRTVPEAAHAGEGQDL